MRRVVKHGALFYVVSDHGRRMGHGYLLREEAEDSLSASLRAAQRRVRACMTCELPFESEGVHNRMCPNCKKRSVG